MKKESKAISKKRNNYNNQLFNKLVDPETSSREYWSILKLLHNGRKILNIPWHMRNRIVKSCFKIFFIYEGAK